MRGGVDQVLPFSGVGIDPFTADEMRNANIRNCCGAHNEYLDEFTGDEKQRNYLFPVEFIAPGGNPPTKECGSKIEVVAH
jgi:hypothetical protein